MGDGSGKRGSVLIGMGNILYGDEGVGVYAARAIQRAFRFTPEVELIDGARLGFGIIEFFCEPASLVLLDALAADAPAGSIFRIPGAKLHELSPQMRPTAHEVDPLQLLRTAPLLGEPPDVTLVGIVAANTSDLALGLTPALKEAFPEFIETALSELRCKGVQVEQVGPVSLEDTISMLVASTYE